MKEEHTRIFEQTQMREEIGYSVDKIESYKTNEVNGIFLITSLIGILGFNLIYYVVVLLSHIISIFGVDANILQKEALNFLNNKLIAMLLSQLLIGLPMCVYIYNKKKLNLKGTKNKRKSCKQRYLKKINIGTLIALALFTYAMIPVMSFINILSMMFVENKISGTIGDIATKCPLWIGIIVVAVMPAFVEEMLFRGVIYTEHRKIDIKMACILNGILFGLLHGNINQFMYAFVMGCVFAFVVEITNSVLSSIWCHFIINANSMCITYVNTKIQMQDSVIEKSSYTWKEVICWGCFAMVALCFALLILIFIAKYNNRYEYIKERLFGTKSKKKKISKYDMKKNVSKEEKRRILFDKAKQLCTVTLICGIVLDVCYMVLIELFT